MIYSDPAATAFADTPTLAACPYFRAVLATFACPLQAVRLMRLAAGSSSRNIATLTCLSSRAACAFTSRSSPMTASCSS
jgi:hypothetical protein